MGGTQKVLMVKYTPHRPKFNYILLIDHLIGQIIEKIDYLKKTTSKSVYDRKEKNNLFTCNMVTCNTRKVLCEKVQVYATLIGCNL